MILDALVNDIGQPVFDAELCLEMLPTFSHL